MNQLWLWQTIGQQSLWLLINNISLPIKIRWLFLIRTYICMFALRNILRSRICYLFPHHQSLWFLLENYKASPRVLGGPEATPSSVLCFTFEAWWCGGIWGWQCIWVIRTTSSGAQRTMWNPDWICGLAHPTMLSAHWTIFLTLSRINGPNLGEILELFSFIIGCHPYLVLYFIDKTLRLKG